MNDTAARPTAGMITLVVSAKEFRRLTGQVPDFKEFLPAAPDLERLDIRRAG